MPVENMAVLAHSVGAVVIAAWVHDYAPPIRALVLATPALRVKLYVPLAVPGLRALQAVKGKAFIKSYVKSSMLTHDPEQARAYQEDPLISRDIAVNILLGLHDASTRLVADAGAIRVPTLLLAAGSDWVVKLSAQRQFFERLGSPVKAMHVYPGFYHAIFHEKDRHQPIAEAHLLPAERPRAALRTTLAAGRRQARLHEGGIRPALPTSAGLVAASPGIRRDPPVDEIAGDWSRGVRVGWQTGFDSGQSLDYVYENRAQGFTPLGKLFDRGYLDSVGWRGIRQRKVNLERMLRTAIKKVHADDRPVRVVDVAAGPGRYLLDTLKQLRTYRSRRYSATAASRAWKPVANSPGRWVWRTSRTPRVTRSTPNPWRRSTPDPPSPSCQVCTSCSRITAGVHVAPRAGRRSGRWRLSDLHESALAPASGVHRPGAD